jgi:hypothetical protein
LRPKLGSSRVDTLHAHHCGKFAVTCACAARTDSAAATHAAVAGKLGIGLAPLWQIRGLVDDGVVQVILEDFETVKTAIYVVWPPTKIPLAKTKLFTEFLAATQKRLQIYGHLSITSHVEVCSNDRHGVDAARHAEMAKIPFEFVIKLPAPLKREWTTDFFQKKRSAVGAAGNASILGR